MESFAPRALLVLLVAASLLRPAREQEPPRRPNIVVILADDMGYGDVHAWNPDSRIPTPNLDGLAASGVTFTDAHSPSAVCTPTRYGLLTGRYSWRGVLKKGVINGYGEPLLEAGRDTLADVLRGAGYRTAMVGKWHLGLEWPREGEEIDFTKPVGDGPKAHGFDSSTIIPASLDFPPYVYVRDGRVTEPDTVEQAARAFPAFLRRGPRAKDLVMENVLDDLTDRALEEVRAGAEAEEPFFLYFALPAPHKPVLPHPRFRGRTGLGDYGDFVLQVDDAVGRVLAALEDTGVADETLVIYTSDNGSFMVRFDDPGRPDHTDDATIQGYRGTSHRANGPLRGTKADIWEAGHRVPFLVRWPGVVAPGTKSDRTICHTDVLATLCEVLGVPLGSGRGEDSFSFLPAAKGEEGAARPPVIHHSGSGMFAIRGGRWKLVAGNGSGGREEPKGEPFGAPFQLFDLAADPGETTDLLAREPDVALRLAAELERLRAADGSRD